MFFQFFSRSNRLSLKKELRMAGKTNSIEKKNVGCFWETDLIPFPRLESCGACGMPPPCGSPCGSGWVATRIGADTTPSTWAPPHLAPPSPPRPTWARRSGGWESTCPQSISRRPRPGGEKIGGLKINGKKCTSFERLENKESDHYFNCNN